MAVGVGDRAADPHGMGLRVDLIGDVFHGARDRLAGEWEMHFPLQPLAHVGEIAFVDAAPDPQFLDGGYGEQCVLRVVNVPHGDVPGNDRAVGG